MQELGRSQSASNASSELHQPPTVIYNVIYLLLFLMRRLGSTPRSTARNMARPETQGTNEKPTHALVTQKCSKRPDRSDG